MTSEDSEFRSPLGASAAPRETTARKDPSTSIDLTSLAPQAGQDAPPSLPRGAANAILSNAAPDLEGSSSSTAVNKELQRLNRAVSALSACNQAMAQAGSESELLQQFCDVIVEMGAYRFAWIGFAIQDELKTVQPTAYAGHEEGYLKEILVTWSEEEAGRGPMGRAIRDNQCCVIADTENDPRFKPWRDAALERGYAAMIALPLRVAGASFGALGIYSGQKGSFEKSEVELLSEIANSLSYGITAIRAQDESRKVTAALREAEAKYRQLVEQVPAISYVAEAGVYGRFLYVSPQVKTILGYQAEDCVADPRFWWDHLNPEDYPTAMLEDTWAEGIPFRVEYRMRRQDGEEVWLRDEAVIVRDPSTGKRLTRGLLVDITERKLADEALRRSEEKYRRFVEQSSEGIYRTEHNPPVPVDLPLEEQIKVALQSGYVAECNDAMAQMYGLKEAGELLGKRLSDFLIADDPVTREFMMEFIRSGYRINDRESHERDAQGRVKIFRNTMVGIVERGCLMRTWGIQRDVTARIHLEEQLRNAQQLEAIGRLAGGVAHDFNNILSIILGHGELLLAQERIDESTRTDMEQIQRAAERAALLTQQLLAFSRKQVLQPKVLVLNEAVTGVQKMLTRVIGEDIEVIAKLNPELAPVKADPGQVEQVLMNLAVNARDAMPHGGKLVMETANVEIEAEQGEDLELAPGRYVMLKVTDTGHGMDAGTLSHIFEPFFTTKETGKGTGLGLAMVYGIVKQSGGGIRVRSDAGAGSEFCIFLPAVKDAPSRAPERVTQQRVRGGKETILIAEDEPDLRELTCLFLESYGYRVLAAANAEQALATADNFSEPIDLLLTDVIMPGMSGRQLAEKIQAKRPTTRVVYMTGYTDDMVMQHRVLEPGVQLVQKPFSKQDLALKVRATLDAK